MATETTLRKLFIDELRDVYHAEKQLTKALPKLAKASTSPELREAFESHLEETQRHTERLEQVFALIQEPAKTKTCTGMQGIIEEGSELLKDGDKGALKDAGLISSAQRAEHYEMAAYGTLIAWAKALGEDQVLQHLEATLDEEKAADEKLTELAEDGINAEAAGNGEETGEDEESEGSDEVESPSRSSRSSKAGSLGRNKTRM